ncbi:UDP-3-O-(3-hydroxymyristoyl)glucosamine N-acyltransferase [Achromobacter sp. SIMBA_011]|uniref:UDP-3-O-(3-hydroxymyristoyl)glucosamine N-acyltransferase n=1 Tax=Achromobacter TaxID=222 RepID=UPI0006C55494|nr:MULTISPECIES: UDP-3-O-(3-hydroxymyristoyl)glucosamine N-acyltransferase [Achromobacter]MBQ2647208.1 UDP-3-O-(3-hydroxymyristoyl)glucosamine N-acyltransferase [Achromobacter sp.]MCZ8409421.1 UDP-3-O-(3-hydroxymyristoyl)glucosamine N-acyltransferase [Achromobacter dolens]MCZ8439489.1 UDP-3-O-(3-hydroxymyristoyl)glucosamine N-acyltransferase [Achromobacter xylosoxidans]OAS95103.1 UDP-3-O-(3-hydroxymyristoyl)glucosamine N-acyltransferase [Achromobacter xylosoxidans]CAB3823277.1 UDP-3-O-acylgluc
MPVLLDLARAPTLEALLSAANTQGMDWRISAPAGADPLRVCGIGTLASASGHEISFLANPKYQSQLAATQAGAVIVSADVAETLEAAGADRPRFTLVVCKHPYLLYARVAQWFDAARRPALPASTHPSAVVAPDAHIEEDVRIGPNCVIESGARIGRGSVLGAGCVIGVGSSIGPDSRLHAHVTLYEGVKIGARAIIHSGAVLGADGFGFAPDPSLGKGAWGKIPQLGGVTVGDDVEIGANTTIDRGALEDTVVGNGVKLDNQIMVAHNCRIGAYTAIAACVGVAGSTTIGERCTIGGAAMLSGHLTLGDDVHISGGTAVTSNISKPGRYTGVYPYAEHGEWQRNAAVIQQLAQLRRRLRTLEKD